MTSSTASKNKLQLIKGIQNPQGAGQTELYLLEGDAISAPVEEIIPAEGITIQESWKYQRRPFRLKVLHFNDLHGNISRIRSTSGNVPIFSRIANRIREAREEVKDNPFASVLVFSGGDDIVGSPFDCLVGEEPESYIVHVGYRLYSQAGIDLGVIGNHGFDLGTKLLSHAVKKDAQFPLLAANLTHSEDLKGLYYPAAILVTKGLRVGVIGLTTPSESRSREGSAFEIVNPVPVVQNLLPQLKRWTDVVIIVSHLGLSLKSTTAPVREAGDVELARSLPSGSVDLIVGGHSHDVLNENGLEIRNVVNRIPIVQAGHSGRYLGEVDITMRDEATVSDVRLNFTAEMPVDETFEKESVEPIFDQIQTVFEQNLGQVVDNWEVSRDASCDDCAFNESALHNFITDGLMKRWRAMGFSADFSVLDSAALRDGLKPGKTLRYGDWLRVMPYADTVYECHVTGKELADFIRDNARRVDISGDPHQERGFLHFSKEIQYRIEISTERSEIKVAEMTFEGQPIEKLQDRTFTFLCTSFMRGLAEPWEKMNARELNLFIIRPRSCSGTDTGYYIRDLMLEHIRLNGGVTQKGGAVRDGRLIVI